MTDYELKALCRACRFVIWQASTSRRDRLALERALKQLEADVLRRWQAKRAKRLAAKALAEVGR